MSSTWGISWGDSWGSSWDFQPIQDSWGDSWGDSWSDSWGHSTTPPPGTGNALRSGFICNMGRMMNRGGL